MNQPNTLFGFPVVVNPDMKPQPPCEFGSLKTISLRLVTVDYLKEHATDWESLRNELGIDDYDDYLAVDSNVLKRHGI